MSDKYVVSQEFMNELEEWKDTLRNIDDGLYISTEDFIDLPVNILEWRDSSKYTKENNNRLITIIRWVNGEDVFEVEKHKKWVVRSKETDSGNDHVYLTTINIFGIKTVKAFYSINKATKFDTKEEAESWANSHQEVIEVDE